MESVGRWAGIAAAAALAMGSAASAAPCWTPREVGAARVRQVQTMLMVATLRCRAGGVDIVADYDGFVTAQARTIAAANLVIKEHFAAAGGTQSDYDRFATTLANRYGSDDTGDSACAEAAAVAREATGAGSIAALDAIAAARLFPAALPGGACEAPETSPLVLAAAAPVPAEPVELPADVVAALGVMARLHQADTAPASAAPATQVAAAGR